MGLGANLSTSEYGGPRETLSAALTRFPQHGIAVLRRSRWYASAPVPASDQPWFVNAIVAVAYRHEPSNLLAVLHDIENEYGRQRRRLWEARPIDLDLIAYGARTTPQHETARGLVLPHPRAHERAFVLLPLREIAPTWRHPRSGIHIDQLCDALTPDQVARPLGDGPDDKPELTV